MLFDIVSNLFQDFKGTHFHSFFWNINTTCQTTIKLFKINDVITKNTQPLISVPWAKRVITHLTHLTLPSVSR